MLQSRIFFIVLLCITVLSSIRLVTEINRRGKINSEVNSLKMEITRLQEDQSRMNSLINYLNTDMYIEEEARKKLQLRKAGERLVVVQNSSDAPLMPESEIDNSAIKLWYEYFFSPNE